MHHFSYWSKQPVEQKQRGTENKKLIVDYCVELLLFVLVLCKTTLPPTSETERTLIKNFNFEDSLQSLYA